MRAVVMIKAGITNTDFSVTAQDPRKEEALASYPLECVVIVGVPARGFIHPCPTDDCHHLGDGCTRECGFGHGKG